MAFASPLGRVNARPMPRSIKRVRSDQMFLCPSFSKKGHEKDIRAILLRRNLHKTA